MVADECAMALLPASAATASVACRDLLMDSPERAEGKRQWMRRNSLMVNYEAELHATA
jgi:hypothetical protein